MCAGPFPLIFSNAGDFVLDQAKFHQTKGWLDRTFGAAVPVDSSWLAYSCPDGHCFQLIWDEVGEWQLHVHVLIEQCTMRFTSEICALARELRCHLYCQEFDLLIDADESMLRRLMLRAEGWALALSCGEMGFQMP